MSYFDGYLINTDGEILDVGYENHRDAAEQILIDAGIGLWVNGDAMDHIYLAMHWIHISGIIVSVCDHLCTQQQLDALEIVACRTEDERLASHIRRLIPHLTVVEQFNPCLEEVRKPYWMEEEREEDYD